MRTVYIDLNGCGDFSTVQEAINAITVSKKTLPEDAIERIRKMVENGKRWLEEGN